MNDVHRRSLILYEFKVITNSSSGHIPHAKGLGYVMKNLVGGRTGARVHYEPPHSERARFMVLIVLCILIDVYDPKTTAVGRCISYLVD